MTVRSLPLLTAALLLCACAAPPPAPSAAPRPAQAEVPAVAAARAPDPQVLGLWRIEQARSAPLLDKRQARLEFGADGMLVGHTSCNTLRAPYTLAGDRLKIGPIATGRKHCGDALMEQEDRVLTALERAARATVPPHGFLTVQDPDGAVLLRASRFETPPQ